MTPIGFMCVTSIGRNNGLISLANDTGGIRSLPWNDWTKYRFLVLLLGALLTYSECERRNKCSFRPSPCASPCLRPFVLSTPLSLSLVRWVLMCPVEGQAEYVFRL